jgi:predicted ATPase
MMASGLQYYVGSSGHAQTLLYYGPKVTQYIEAHVECESDRTRVKYSLNLAYAVPDSLIIAAEELSSPNSSSDPSGALSLGSGKESQIPAEARQGRRAAQLIQQALNSISVYHFQDASMTAALRQHRYISDDRRLAPEAGNLAAFLLRLREESGGVAYKRIVSTIRMIAPFFGDFDLEPTGPYKKEIILNWREKGSDQVFGPHQLSDGTLRTICLITLLLQPEAELPDLIIVDEPELGLHPYALNVVASLFKKASHHTQMLVSTQSSSFLDNFDPEDIVVVNREGKESQFQRPDPEKLKAWLDDYSLGEVWEKNVIGGGPH